MRQREFIEAGISAGVAVAFGAPIGGALFAYEISTPNTFWTFQLLWRNFFCSAVATFILGVCTSLWEGHPVTLSDSAMLKFGITAQEHRIPLYELPGTLIIGAICGLMGAGFVYANEKIGKIRKSFLKKNWMKVFEVTIFAAVTSITFFSIAIIMNRCVEKNDDSFPFYRNGACVENQYSPMATLFFNTEGGTIRSLLSKAVELTTYETLAFLIAWYFLFITTYGV